MLQKRLKTGRIIVLSLVIRACRPIDGHVVIEFFSTEFAPGRARHHAPADVFVALWTAPIFVVEPRHGDGDDDRCDRQNQRPTLISNHDECKYENDHEDVCAEVDRLSLAKRDASLILV